MSPIVPWDMAGLSITLTTSRLTTLRRMTSVERVCFIFLHGVLGRVDLTQYFPFFFSQLVPKFQGENFYKNRAIVEEIKKLASRKGCTISQIALAWVAAQGMIAIPGTTKAPRLVENWASRDIDLTEEEKREMRRIIDAAKPHGNRYGPAQQAQVGH